MGNFLCANLDKKEYFDFSVYSDNTMEDSPACNTLEYFLATEWAGDRIVFYFQENEQSIFYPDKENAYDYVKRNYTERGVLRSVPQYEYVANISKKEYYRKSELPKGAGSSCVCPLPFILTQSEGNIVYVCLEKNEVQHLGKWIGDNILVTNNKKLCEGYNQFESPYIIDNVVRRLAGLNIVIAGVINGYTMEDMEKCIDKRGGTLQSKVTRNTDIVVLADYMNEKIKVDAAKKYGIKMLSEEDFFEMIGF